MEINDIYVTLLLTNGDELISTLDGETETEYVLSSPLITLINDGKMLIRHYSRLTTTETFIIHKRHVIFCNPLAQEFIVKYVEFLQLHNETTKTKPTDNVVSMFTPIKLIH